MNYQDDIIFNFKPRHSGRYVYGNHYVTVRGNVVNVENADFYKKVDGHWQKVHEDGFSYKLD